MLGQDLTLLATLNYLTNEKLSLSTATTLIALHCYHANRIMEGNKRQQRTE